MTVFESVLERAVFVPDHPTEEGGPLRQRASGPVLVVEANNRHHCHHHHHIMVIVIIIIIIIIIFENILICKFFCQKKSPVLVVESDHLLKEEVILGCSVQNLHDRGKKLDV